MFIEPEHPANAKGLAPLPGAEAAVDDAGTGTRRGLQLRPDDVEVVDALYRLRTDDGVAIIIHNVGLTYPGAKSGEERYRLTPQFIAPVGKYDWLNKNIFIATLSDVPKDMQLAKGPGQNDRLIQVYRVY